jgi:glycosyltransferase involved in cell wall biosynthesis
LSGFVGNVYDQYGIPYTVIPNIINFREGVFRKRQEIRPRFINIRSFYETYNIECTLRAFARVQKAYPDASLTLLGDGPLREKMEMCVKELRLRNVTFVGQVKNTEIYKYLDQKDIMISSSRFDNMPVSILEGFNAGLLVIATRVGGIPYMIQDGENGMLFEDDDDFDLAERMIKALENQVKTKDMIIMAHQSLEKYSWRHCYSLLIKLYTGE